MALRDVGDDVHGRRDDSPTVCALTLTRKWSRVRFMDLAFRMRLIVRQREVSIKRRHRAAKFLDRPMLANAHVSSLAEMAIGPGIELPTSPCTRTVRRADSLYQVDRIREDYVYVCVAHEGDHTFDLVFRLGPSIAAKFETVSWKDDSDREKMSPLGAVRLLDQYHYYGTAEDGLACLRFDVHAYRYDQHLRLWTPSLPVVLNHAPTDVRFQMDDGVLCAHRDFFRAHTAESSFLRELLDLGDDTICLPGAGVDEFGDILRFLYGARPTLNDRGKDALCRLLHLANWLDLPEVKCAVEAIICDPKRAYITIDSGADDLICAFNLNLPLMLERALLLYTKEPARFRCARGWLRVQEDPALLVTIHQFQPPKVVNRSPSIPEWKRDACVSSLRLVIEESGRGWDAASLGTRAALLGALHF